MSFTPTKGSPKPPVPGPNIFETAYLAVENLVAKIPASVSLENEIAIVEAALSSVLQTVDPDGQKAAQRTQILDAAYALTQVNDPASVASGVAAAVTFAQDVPAHPTAWVRYARWICVESGAPDPLPGGP